MREKAPLPSRSKPDEAWNIHSYLGGDPFVDHFILYALGDGGNSAGKRKDDQEIRSRVARLVFTAANGYGICLGARGSPPARGKVSVEEGNCDDRFLDRRAAEWK